jgi:hypothetical protein
MLDLGYGRKKIWILDKHLGSAKTGICTLISPWTFTREWVSMTPSLEAATQVKFLVSTMLKSCRTFFPAIKVF